jgi:uncharacterized protein
MKKDKSQGLARRNFLKGMTVAAAATLVAPGTSPAQPPPMADQKHSGEKIDLFCHIIPPKFKEVLFNKSDQVSSYLLGNTKALPMMFDLELRFRMMDKYEGLRHVLDLSAPVLETVLGGRDAPELARMANDEMAELMSKYPDRFVGAVAALPMSDIDAAVREAERAMKELKLNGIQLCSSIYGKPLDRPEFIPLYEKMAEFDQPIWIHPVRDSGTPDYPGEKSSQYNLFSIFGWPFETTLAMGRIVFSGIMEKYPNLKFIPHHCGAMVPFFAGRVPAAVAQSGHIAKLTKPGIQYFKTFYGDTVINGNTPALMCGYAFFGADHMVFATDYPYPGGAARNEIEVGDVIKSVERMNIPPEEKAKIFSGNARRLLKLS